MKNGKTFLAILITMVCSAVANGTETVIPQWWVDKGIVTSTENQFTSSIVEDNYSVANVGQLMLVATQAAVELNDKLQGGAGSEIDNMIDGFPLYDSENPDANYAALNIGQLKYVAQKFYDRLSTTFDGTVNWNNIILISGGTDSSNHKYPWGAMSNPPTQSQIEENYTVANVGQIKFLFSWSVSEIEEEQSAVDSNDNGVPDSWELEYFGELVTHINADHDGDGLSTMDEFLLGSNPTLTDTDGDGIPDLWEHTFGLNLLDANDANEDKDNDGLTNLEEFQYGTNPNYSDTDGDRLPDKREIEFGLNPLKYASYDELQADYDEDGLPTYWELNCGLDPFDPTDALLDKDEDGLTNYEEYFYGTDAEFPDCDNDGLLDGEEINIYFTDPLNQDTDGDRLSDKFEVDNNFDPLTPLTPAELASDWDNDGMSNKFELDFRLNPFDASDANEDKDNDGLTNLEEFQYGTNPNYSDTDGDRLPDKREIEFGLNPLVYASYEELQADYDEDGLPTYWELDWELDPFDPTDALLDPDGDGLTNLEEFQYGTYVTLSDSDNDGLLDGEEINIYFTDPLNQDTDGDGFSDKFEVDNNLDPRNPLTDADFEGDWDNDGMSNKFEMGFRLNPFDASDADEDADGDGLTNIEEYTAGTNPCDIRFISPANNSVFLVGSAINLWIDVPHSDKIEEVRLYRNGVLLKTIYANAPIYVHLDNAAPQAGIYEYTAIAVYNQSYPADSSQASILVLKQDSSTPSDPWEPISDGDDGPLAPLPGNAKEVSFSDPNDYMGGSQAHYVITYDEFYVEEVTNYSFSKPTICLVEVIASSSEYPYYTGYQSEYNDYISWQIQASWGSTVSGSINVNDLHNAFDEGGRCIVARYIFTMPSNESSPSLMLMGGVQNISDGILDSSVAFRIVEIELTSDSVAEESYETFGIMSFNTSERIVKYGGTMCIEPHANNGGPKMPSFGIRKADNAADKRVDWVFTSKSERTQRGNKDNIRIPGSGSAITHGSEVWYVSSQMGDLIFGGNAEISFSSFSGSGDYRFKIRGKNPYSSNVIAEINSLCSQRGISNYSAVVVGIARLESGSLKPNQYFYQFNKGDLTTGKLAGTPNWGHPDGWGIMQVDSARGTQITTKEVYDWKENLKGGIEVLETKISATNRFFAAVAAAYPNDPDAANPPLSFTVPGTNKALPAKVISTIVLYNGAPYPYYDRQYLDGRPFTNPWTFNPNGNPKWVFRDNQNQHARKVINQMD